MNTRINHGVRENKYEVNKKYPIAMIRVNCFLATLVLIDVIRCLLINVMSKSVVFKSNAFLFLLLSQN